MPRDRDTADGGARGGTGRVKGTATTTPVGTQRRSRITEARGYHPRGRTVGDPAPSRPALRLVTAEEEATRRRTGSDERTARQSTRDSARWTFDDIEPPATKTSRSQAVRAASQAARASAGPSATRRRGAAAAAAAPIRRVSTKVVIPPLANQHRRLKAGLTLMLIVFVILGARLVQFQFADGAAYAAAGLALRLQPVDLPAPRGSIFDRNMAVLAGSAEARYVFADPALVKDPAAAAEALQPILGVPVSELLPKLKPHLKDGTPVRF